mmetsp:Transcript_27850/g.76628  ORF Transcript_27850/g.76628 Transcript_27850/m.76628 type:complete len:89 (-) Transcript_27850:548-814(-)
MRASAAQGERGTAASVGALHHALDPVEMLPSARRGQRPGNQFADRVAKAGALVPVCLASTAILPVTVVNAELLSVDVQGAGDADLVAF